jgi:hypothetical protein
MVWTPAPLDGIKVPDWMCVIRQSTEKKESTMNKLSRAGVDLAKDVFQLHGVDRHGKAIWRRRLMQEKWLKVLLEQIGRPAPGGA